MSPDKKTNIQSLNVEFFNNSNLEGSPAYTGYDNNLTPYWHNLSPAPGINPEKFSVRWSGFLTISTTGTYEFNFKADNLGRIFIGNQLFIDKWDESTKDRDTTKQIYLQAGHTIPFCIEFAKNGGNAGMTLKWRLVDVTSTTLFSDITRAAAKSDMTIVVLGETREEVGESRDRHNLNPHSFDMEILKAAAKAAKPLTTVMITGRPLVLTDICKYSPAVLQAWFPGEATGNAITNVLFGDYNPSGKLTISFPKDQGQLPIFYSRKPSSHRRYVDGDGIPLFPFGHGLSYSTFEYGKLTIEPVNPKITDAITVSLYVKNVSDTDGTEIVQLYINDIVSSVATPVIALKGFSNVFLKAGESKRIIMVLTPEHLSLLNAEMKRVVESGEFEIMVGSSSSDIRQRQTITISE